MLYSNSSIPLMNSFRKGIRIHSLSVDKIESYQTDMGKDYPTDPGESMEKLTTTSSIKCTTQIVSPGRRNQGDKIKDTFLFNVIDALSDIEDFLMKNLANPFITRSEKA